MQTVTVNISEEVNVEEVRRLLLALLVEKGIISSGQAAEQLGISRRQFPEEAGSYGVSIFGETEEDLQQFGNGKSEAGSRA